MPISKLIELLDNADWVNRGRQYIRSDGVCPFCQHKTVTKELEEQFNSFFSGEYEKDTLYIKTLIQNYKNTSEQILLTLSSSIENNSGLSIINFDTDKYHTLYSALKTLLSSTLTEMTTKDSEPSRIIMK